MAVLSLVDTGAAERAADAVLRAAGGKTVLLRFAVNAGAGEAEQLGLATPHFRDAPVGPAAFRNVGSTKILLLSARSVRLALGALGATSAEAVFRDAAGVVVDEKFYRIGGAVAMGSVGQPHCWALELIAPVS